ELISVAPAARHRRHSGVEIARRSCAMKPRQVSIRLQHPSPLPGRQYFLRDDLARPRAPGSLPLRAAPEQDIPIITIRQFDSLAILDLGAPDRFVPSHSSQKIVFAQPLFQKLADRPCPQSDSQIPVFRRRLVSFLQLGIRAAVSESILAGQDTPVP